jgi:hypothetical protein
VLPCDVRDFVIVRGRHDSIENRACPRALDGMNDQGLASQMSQVLTWHPLGATTRANGSNDRQPSFV